jgi:5'-AMP-activated protein kinase catalytic alpha subunit
MHKSKSFQKNIDISELLSCPYMNNELKIGDYILNKKLGQGTFGIVVLAIHEITREKVAIKILDKDKIAKNSDKLRLERKIQIMKKMYHKNIVHLYNVIENNREIFLVMEYIQGKELFEYITEKRHLDEIESCIFYQQIISGIEYLYKTMVAHRDLKPENLLLDSKKNIKIVDFGLSNTYKENGLLSTACGSPCYAAPEMLSGKKYRGVDIDIWSSGIVLYAMLCGYLPFEDSNNQTLYKKIIKGEFNTPKYLSNDAVDLLHKILNVDPEKRYNIDEIKAHPWFNKVNSKIYMSEGLLIDKYIIPFDEDIIKEMVDKYGYNEQNIKINLIINKHNNITTTYYLMLKKKVKSGKETIGDMNSKLFLDYIHNDNNLLSKYQYSIDDIINERILNKNNNIIHKENNLDKNNELNKIEKKKEEISEIRLNKKIISNMNRKSEHNLNDKEKKFYLKKIETNLRDKRNYISFRYNNKEKIKKFDNEELYNNKHKAKMSNKIKSKNVLSQQIFNSTYTENYNKKNLIQVNNDISHEEDIPKKLDNKLMVLKKYILKNRNIYNQFLGTDTNVKDIKFNTFSSTPKSFYFSNKILQNKKKLKNKKEYSKIIDNKINSKERYNKSHNKNNERIGGIRIFKKMSDKKDKNKYKNISKYNYNKEKIVANSTSRLSRTPNNVLKNLNNRLTLENNVKNDLDKNIYEIKEEKNYNNFVTNNSNNINININFTNIIKTENNQQKEKYFYTQDKSSKNKESNYKKIKQLFRINKFLDNSIKDRKFFFNTSVNIEKGKRRTESENKNYKALELPTNHKKEIITGNNLYNKNQNYNQIKETSIKRKIKDDIYLKIKSKNKKFNNFKFNKINNINTNIQKSETNIHNSIKANTLNLKGINISRMKKKNTNIYINSNYNRKNINSINNIDNKTSESKKILLNKKYLNYNKLNTDYNSNKLILTKSNFFSNRRNKLNNMNEINDNNTNKILYTCDNIKKIKFLKPFDLNSIVLIKEGSDIKNKICYFLTNKNIKVKISGKNKYICSKNDINFDVDIINIRENNNAFIIKSFHSQFKSIKSKNFYYNTILKLINQAK